MNLSWTLIKEAEWSSLAYTALCCRSALRKGCKRQLIRLLVNISVTWVPCEIQAPGWIIQVKRARQYSPGTSHMSLSVSDVPLLGDTRQCICLNNLTFYKVAKKFNEQVRSVWSIYNPLFRFHMLQFSEPVDEFNISEIMCRMKTTGLTNWHERQEVDRSI